MEVGEEVIAGGGVHRLEALREATLSLVAVVRERTTVGQGINKIK